MKKQLLTIAALVAVTIGAKAQSDSTSTPLQISGSVDAYWKYDFSKVDNIGGVTSFANDQNSVSLGMIDIALSKTSGKASFVGEVSFGPRGQSATIPNGPDGDSFHIQNLYATYAFTDKFSMTAGYMGTFVGYEVISPVPNFNYSSSYLFFNGPFQNAGIKANYAISDKVGVMVGLFNDWNVYQDFDGVSDFGAQLSLSPVEGWSAYLNLITGGSGTEYDLTTTYQISDKFMLGLNAADKSDKVGDGGFSGVALYPQVSLTDNFALGMRGEYFKFKDTTPEDAVTSLTLTANLKAGDFRFIPEFRLDNMKQENFVKSNGMPTKSASQFSLAFVYAF